jgi:2-amino-4-hydroxy-6-hydroxymethyldihydropteridine diphosphokinase
VTAVAAWLALGSNLGDRHAHLALARHGIAAMAGVRVLRASAIEATAPLGGRPQPEYLNQMLLIETTLAPAELLRRCHYLEQQAGRERSLAWASRTLDIDLVRYDSELCDLPDLVLPHPGLRDRDFWAREIATLEEHV